ncbi:M23 family metallopeptidase [Edaphobacter modestus]|uniref:M23 family metallopeptidase n=1 Tax=Edaphobacter modestus TaxID=388466 RepID=UPI0013EE6DEB|nr:M23 family metallopeptidase [Edaphobacter modestus]
MLPLVLVAFLIPSIRAQPATSIAWTPDILFTGSPCLFRVNSPSLTGVTGTWQGHELSFFQEPKDPDSWYSLAGVDVGAKSGSYELTIELIQQSGTKTIRRTIDVAPAPYKEIPLTVPQKFVEPSEQEQKIIVADQQVKRRIFARSANSPLWTGSFSPPLKSAPRTDSFGTRRIFNGSLVSVHRGLDYRAKVGTPVRAANSARVLLARPLFYEGNCVILDHGLGLMTIYMHLSEFKVREGELVRRGQMIALSGETGRATGPHLHLSVRWQGEYLDPAKLFSLNVPRPVQP